MKVLLRSCSGFSFLFGVLLLFVLAARFFGLYIDPPYNIVSTSGAFFLDEGCYSKSAQLLIRYGILGNPGDVNYYTHNPLFVLWSWGLFKLFGTSLMTTRVASLIVSLLTMGVFLRLLRREFDWKLSLMMLLCVAISMDQVAYSRLAFIEPLGTFVSMLAIACWVISKKRNLFIWGALGFAVTAYFIKTSLVYVLGAVSILVFWDAVEDFRVKKKQNALMGITSIAVAWAFVIGVTGWIHHHYQDDWDRFSGPTIHLRFQGLTFFKMIYHELRLGIRLLCDPSRTVPFAVLVFIICSAMFRSGIQNAWMTLMGALANRLTRAMIGWMLAGLFVFGVSSYQPSRYYYFSIYPMVFLVFKYFQSRIKTPNHLFKAGLFFLVLHAAVLTPGYIEWFARGGESSHTEMSKDIAKQLAGKPVVLGGRLAMFVSLFGENIRPCCEYALKGCTELKTSRPEYFVYPESDDEYFKKQCLGFAKLQILKRYKVFRGWYMDSDIVFGKLEYIN